MTGNTPGRRRGGPLLEAVRLMEPARSTVARAVLLGAAAQGSAIGLIAVSAWLIARASQMPFVLDLTMATVSVRALGIGRGLFRYLERLASHDVALRGMVRLREQVFRRLAEDRTGRVAHLRRGDLLARFGADIDTVGDVVVKGLFPFVVSGVVGLVTVLFVTVVLPPAGLLLACCLLLTGGFAPWLAARAAAAARTGAVDARAELTAQVLAELDGLAELEVAGAGPRRRRVLAQAQNRLDLALDRATGPASLAAAVQVAGVGLAVVGAVLLGAPQVEAGELNPVMLAVLALVPLAASELTVGLPGAATELYAGRRAAQRLLDLVRAGDTGAAKAEDPAADLTPTTPRGTTPAVHAPAGVRALVAEDLVVGWDRPLTQVPRTLRLEPGELMAIQGPSGVGKTTLALTLAGLHPPLDGRVLVDGVPLGQVPDLPHVVAYTAHDAHIFGTTIRENLRVAGRTPPSDEDLLAAARATGLDEWLSTLPESLDTVLTPGGASISGGQRRRLLLTRALLTRARYVILDEPTEHLDPAATRAVLAQLTELATRSGIGIALLTHADVSDARTVTTVHLGSP